MNRRAADEIGNYLQTSFGKQITHRAVEDRLHLNQAAFAFHALAGGPGEDRQATGRPGGPRKRRTQDKNQKLQQMAIDLNSILSETLAKFNDPNYLHDKNNWKDFIPFVKQFDSLLDKISAQAENKTVGQVSPDSDDSDDNDSVDANEMIAQHEYFSLQDGKSILLFAYTGEQEPDSAAPFANTTETIRKHLKELESKYPGTNLVVTGEPALDTDQARRGQRRRHLREPHHRGPDHHALFLQLSHLPAAHFRDSRPHHGGALVARIRARHGGPFQHPFHRGHPHGARHRHATLASRFSAATRKSSATAAPSPKP